jgi:hypothetical protein
MRRFKSYLNVRPLIGGVMGAALTTLPAIAAETAPVPDFAGPWFRNMFNFETPDTGAGPIINLRRLGVDAGRSVAAGDSVPLVGDYNNPDLEA